MSEGSILGGIVGGVIGGILYGPTGAYYGFMLGFSLGTFLDPLTPDVNPPGSPLPDAYETVSSEVGVMIPDLAGTAKIKGHLLWYGNERHEELYGVNENGEAVLIETTYFMSWALGICVGSVDSLYGVSTDQDNIWEGVSDCPASGGEATIALDDGSSLGDLTFYFGTADQVANTKLGAALSDEDLNTPYRYCCWAYVDDYCLGNYPRMPSLSFLVRKVPVFSFSADNVIQIHDCNPAHILWYILHDLTGLPESWLNTAAFTTFAETLYAENRGLSFLFDRTQSALDYIESLNAHISGFLRYGSDAKFHPGLIREDYDFDTLPVVDESDLLAEPEVERRSWIDTINEVKVQYSCLANRLLYSQVQATGENSDGQLGLGHEDAINVFTQVEYKRWQHLSVGQVHTVGIASDGSLWGAGSNLYGSLGLGAINAVNTFTQISTDVWSNVAAGYAHTVGIKEDGTVWSTGYNDNGQLGLGDIDNRDVFTQVPGFYASKVECGYRFTILINSSDASAWGTGNSGCFGDSASHPVLSFKEIGTGPFNDAVCGNRSTFLLKQDGTIWGSGANNQGQLGLGHYIPCTTGGFEEIPITDVSKLQSGGNFSVFVKTDGTLWGTGSNSHHQLGLGETRKVHTFTQIDARDCIAFSCGDSHLMTIFSDYTLWAMGQANYGQLGLGDLSADISPLTQVGTALWSQVECGKRHNTFGFLKV